MLPPITPIIYARRRRRHTFEEKASQPCIYAQYYVFRLLVRERLLLMSSRAYSRKYPPPGRELRAIDTLICCLR